MAAGMRVPHVRQNASSGVTGAPHEGHARALGTATPHFRQKASSAAAGEPQLGQGRAVPLGAAGVGGGTSGAGSVVGMETPSSERRARTACLSAVA